MGAHGNNKAITATINRGISEFIRWLEGLCNGTRARLELPRACMYGGLKYLILSSCERIAVENDSECALRKTVSAPNGEPRARGRQRPSKLAISLAHRLTGARTHTHTRRCHFSFFLRLFLRCRGNGLPPPLGFLAKKHALYFLQKSTRPLFRA